MTGRSLLAEVRNPVLVLPGVRRLRELPPEIRKIIAGAFIDLSKDCRARAQHCWKKNKGPMALYWKVWGVYSYHFARALRS